MTTRIICLYYDGCTCSVCAAGSKDDTSDSRCCAGLTSKFLIRGIRMSCTGLEQCFV